MSGPQQTLAFSFVADYPLNVVLVPIREHFPVVCIVRDRAQGRPSLTAIEFALILLSIFYSANHHSTRLPRLEEVKINEIADLSRHPTFFTKHGVKLQRLFVPAGDWPAQICLWRTFPNLSRGNNPSSIMVNNSLLM